MDVHEHRIAETVTLQHWKFLKWNDYKEKGLKAKPSPLALHSDRSPLQDNLSKANLGSVSRLGQPKQPTAATPPH
jgi:hypothetical protein